MSKQLPEIVSRGRSYYWNHKEGMQYYLGYHHGHVAGMGMIDQQSVSGFYFGQLDGKHKFYRHAGDEIFEYASQREDNKVIWMSDGDDEPSIPFVSCEFIGKIDRPLEREFMLRTLKRFEQRVRS